MNKSALRKQYLNRLQQEPGNKWPKTNAEKVIASNLTENDDLAEFAKRGSGVLTDLNERSSHPYAL